MPLKLGSKQQRLSRKLFLILMPLMAIVCLAMVLLQVDKGWVLIAAAIFTAPVGWVSRKADNAVSKKDDEISAFFRSLGGTATSRGTTLKEALASMKLNSFPALQPDIRMLDLRLKSFGKPALCWQTFGVETGSKLADQSTGIFYEAVNLGGDPEKAGNLISMFAMKTAMLRAQRRGIGSTFSWLTLAMHAILAGLMVFLMGILAQFAVRLDAAMSTLGEGANADAALGLKNMFAFNPPQIQFLDVITTGMVIVLAAVNAFAIVGSEGSHLIKITYYLSLLLLISGICFLIIPSLAAKII